MKAEDIARLGTQVTEAPTHELPALVGELARLQALALARLTAAGRENPPEHEEDRLLTPEEAAQLAGLPDPAGRGRRRIYEWARGQRWATRPSRKTLRIAETAFRRWLMSRRA
jgi:hypothetical protein